MRTTLSTLLAAACLGLAQFAAAADQPYTAQPPVDRPARAIEADTAKAGGATAKPGRTVEVDPEMALSDRDRAGRAIDDGTLRTSADPQRPGRQADEK
jgi:hypothetical protein